jgi:hypothetical protein
MKKSGRPQITRRSFMKTAGALAAGAAVPGVATAPTTTPGADRQHALDHVVIMFENRSFDNLLGRLYQPPPPQLCQVFIRIIPRFFSRQLMKCPFDYLAHVHPVS